MDKLIALISDFFSHHNPKGKSVAVLSFLFIGILILVATELFTGINFFQRMEKKTQLLKDLQEIANIGIAQNPDLYPIYKETIREISEYKITPIDEIRFSLSNEPFLKALSGALLWIIMGVLTFFGVFGDKDIAIGVIVSIIIAIIFGYIATLIPTIFNPWVNYLGFPIIQLVIVIILGTIYTKKIKPVQQKI